MDEADGCPPKKKLKTMDEILLDIGSSSTVSQAIKDDVLKMENVNLFKCQVCKITVTGIIPAEAHLQGVKHKKAVQKFKLDAAVEQNYDIPDSFISVQAAIKSKLVSCNHLGNQMVLTCVLCNKSCSGEVPMAQHLSSEAHAKKMRHGSLTSSCEKFPIPNTCTRCYDSVSPTNVPPSMQDFPVSDNPHSMDFIPISPDVQAAIKSGLISSTQLGNQVILTCVPCNKPCSGEMPMMQHLNCEAHAKKMRHGVQYSSCSLQTGRPIITIPAITQCSLTSPADIQLVQGDLLAQAMKEGTIKASENTANHLYCTVCDVSCTGEDCMKNHLQGKSHFKMLKVFQQTSKQSLRSSVSSTINNTAAQHSPSPPEDSTAHKDKSVSPHFSPISPVSGLHCKDQWESILSQYHEHVNKTKPEIRQAVTISPKWKCEDQMTFLNTFMKDRLESSSSTEEAYESQDENSSKQEIRNMKGASYKECLPSNQMCPKCKKTLQHNRNNISTTFMKYLLEKNDESDSDITDAFFLMMGAVVKNFNPSDQHFIRTKLFSLVSEIEKKYIQHQNSLSYAEFS
ncbi:uncharacterized protein LOC135101447 isoform X2 [Scylla paramamosain]|uniref:uncharacterized protein LOC135101447 isoform X2 n=1 Tax=Scylla paramamosain TaxID=85552 RepID=UPI003082D65A